MAAHPVVPAAFLERVRRRAVHEHVHEEAAVRLEPAAHAAEQRRPVAHVLEHLHRDDAVEALARVEVVHVPRDDVHVREPAPRGLALRSTRAAKCELDTAVMRLRRKARSHPQSERAPAAAELEDLADRRASRRARRSLASAAASAASSVSTPSGHQHELYLRCGPSTAAKNAAGTS